MNYLIETNGKTYDVSGIEHQRFCTLVLKMTLNKFLKLGGTRVKIHLDHMAIESNYGLTEQQMKAVKNVLKENVIYSLVTDIANQYNSKVSFRAIRGL